MEQLWWISLSDEKLVDVRLEDVSPGDRNTFLLAQQAAIKRVYEKSQLQRLRESKDFELESKKKN